MSQQYTTMSLEAIKLLCATINKTVDLPNTVISDTSIATNTTYSSHRLDKEFTTLEDELKHYTDTAIAGLNKLTKEIINDKSLVVKDNVTTGLTYKGKKVWHESNQGHGSGLDADTLDGKHKEYFAAADHLHDDRYIRNDEVNLKGKYKIEYNEEFDSLDFMYMGDTN